MESNDIYKLISKGAFSISTDTRTLITGDIYIGIKGENFDGNSFTLQAIEKGASYVITDLGEYKTNEKCIIVRNTRKTLEELARIHRQQFSIPVVAIGGSNGKTTTKELITSVLSKKYIVHTTKGNLNNDIGVPLTLLSMPKETEVAIVEIGANHKDEHIKLLNIISPTHVLVTNNGQDHLEGFGSAQGAREANKEIYDWAQINNAKAFVYKELPDLMEDSQGLDIIIYPKEESLSKSSIYAKVSYKNTLFESSLFGSYNEANILASITVGEYFDVPLEKIQEAVKEYEPTLKRSQIIENKDYRIVLDCYNANPSSMELALKDFFDQTKEGDRVAIIGDMFEMGQEEKRVHKEILELVSSLIEKKDIVLCVGPRFYVSKELFPFTFFETTEKAREYFNSLDLQGKTIFVKASRGMKLEEIIKERIPLG